MSRFPKIDHENGDVKCGKSRNRPAWNPLENHILTSVLEHHLSTYRNVDYDKVWEEIYRFNPDWQRSLLAVKSHAAELIKLLQTRQNEKSAEEMRRQNEMVTKEMHRLSDNVLQKAETEKFLLEQAYKTAFQEALDAAEKEKTEFQEEILKKKKEIADKTKELNDMTQSMNDLNNDLANMKFDLEKAHTDLEEEKKLSNDTLYNLQKSETQKFVAEQRTETIRRIQQATFQLCSNNEMVDKLSTQGIENWLLTSSDLVKEGTELPPLMASDIPEQDDQKPSDVPSIPIDK